MPDNVPTETPPERVMRQWYQSKIGERLGQFAEMQASRDLLRRGAKKMQDGTLGQSTGEPELEDMNIRVGDEVNYFQLPPQQPAPAPAPQPTAPPDASAPASPAPVAATPTEQPKSAWKTWLARSALAAGGLAAGVGGLAGYNWLTAPDANEKPPAVEQPAEPQGTPQALPYTPPTIIGPGVSTEKWDHLPGEK